VDRAAVQIAEEWPGLDVDTERVEGHGLADGLLAASRHAALLVSSSPAVDVAIPVDVPVRVHSGRHRLLLSRRAATGSGRQLGADGGAAVLRQA
jgi:hypothetical protein